MFVLKNRWENGERLGCDRDSNSSSFSPFLVLRKKKRKAHSRIKMAITFPRQNDVGSHAHTTYYWGHLVLEVILVLKSKAFYTGKK